MRRIRMRFWLCVMEAICLVPGGFGSRAYEWALDRACNATDWGYCPPVEGEEPF
jgi:hypothetical protein